MATSVGLQKFEWNIVEVEERVRPATAVSFHEVPPHEVSEDGARTWYARSENMVVAYTEGRKGTVLARSGQADEYFTLLPDPQTPVEFTTDDGSRTVPGAASVIVPPGNSEVRMQGDGRIFRVMTVASAPELAERAANAEAYSWPDNHIPPFRPWSSPPSGFRLRVYPHDEEPAVERDGWHSVFVSSTILVNWVKPVEGRDICLRNGERRRMSAHHHTQIDQVILMLEGDFRMHMRVPWTAEMSDWRPDDHIEASAPAFIAIPAQVIHATEAVGSARLMDIFCPPRGDYAELETCRNREEYPPS